MNAKTYRAISICGNNLYTDIFLKEYNNNNLKILFLQDLTLDVCNFIDRTTSLEELHINCCLGLHTCYTHNCIDNSSENIDKFITSLSLSKIKILNMSSLIAQYNMINKIIQHTKIQNFNYTVYSAYINYELLYDNLKKNSFLLDLKINKHNDKQIRKMLKRNQLAIFTSLLCIKNTIKNKIIPKCVIENCLLPYIIHL